MCIVSKRTNNAYGIGICPDYLIFHTLKRNMYEEDPTAIDDELKQFENKGIIKISSSSKKELILTLILREGDKKIKEVQIECVDRLQTMFFLSHIEEIIKKGCFHFCELPCCILKELTSVL